MKIFYIEEASKNNRIIGLDILRSAAILMVLLEHGNRIVHIPVPVPGFYGVELFFVLSGFLIGTILIRVFNDVPRVERIGNFWIRRWFRTLPNYYLFLLGNIAMAFWVGTQSVSFFQYIVFLQCLTRRVTPIMAESWSLCIEEWFYLLFPLWLFMFSKIINDRRKMILFAILAFIVFFTVLRIGIYYSSMDRPWDDGFRCATLLRLDSIAYGVLGAWINRFHQRIFFKYKTIFLITGVAGLISTAALLSRQPTEFVLKTIIFTWVNGSFALLIPFFVEFELNNKLMRYMISHTSVISYSLYLIHFSFVPVILGKVNVVWLPFEYLLYWLLSFFIATVVYNFYERKMTSLRNRISYGEKDFNQCGAPRMKS